MELPSALKPQKASWETRAPDQCPRGGGHRAAVNGTPPGKTISAALRETSAQAVLQQEMGKGCGLHMLQVSLDGYPQEIRSERINLFRRGAHSSG